MTPSVAVEMVSPFVHGFIWFYKSVNVSGMAERAVHITDLFSSLHARFHSVHL